ncbi:MAG TPA: protein kinase [Anaeromyxobacteraceae bacterium]|nr:protein kinase [Anaeromyxobacteraceae bacterium]
MGAGAGGNGHSAPDPGVKPGALSALLQEIAEAPRAQLGEGWGPALHPGAVVGRFELVRELGRGGFGVVWEAKDRELGRSVAFKAVRAGGQAGVREERLLREAEAAARLSHPNIVTLYDVGRSQHGPYLVLELLKGRTLEERRAQGRVPVEEALRIAVEVAKGIAHAHSNGVVHRDLSPANVFLCDGGQVKVVDFGMAHAFGQRKVDGGTRAYMAPEQARGAPEDERSDVFAFGVILHQMLSGELPFKGQGRERTRPAPELEIPGAPALGALVARMLERDPLKRPRDGGQVLSALSLVQAELGRAGARPPPEDMVPAGGAPPREAPAEPEGRARSRRRAAPSREAAASIAVLPFADLSPAKDQDYFCDGIAEELLGALSAVEGLRVASRGSSFQFKGQAVDSREMGKALGVATLLEGSVRKAGNRVRVSARLVNAGDGYQRWSEAFDRRLEDIFAIQEEIAQAVVRALQLRLSAPGEAQLTRIGTRDAQAYEMYLRGRKFLMQHGETSLRLARQMFRGAIELDPGFAQAHAGLADADFFMLQWNLDPDRAAERGAEALAESEEALRLQPDLAEAHVSRANVLSLHGRGEEAERDFQRALELNPGLGDACYFYARHLQGAGRRLEAAEMFEEAARRNPDDYNAVCLLPMVYDDERGLAAARRCVEVTERRLRQDPDDVRALYFASGAHLRLGDRERGLERLGRAMELYPDDFTTLYNVACNYAVAGERERALDALERAVAGGRGSRRWIEHDTDLESLRSDPRFQEIMRRVKSD